MKMKELADLINVELKYFSPPEIKSIYDLESALFILNLKKLIDQCKNDESSISKKSIAPFVSLLENRWNTIMNSDAIEQYFPQSQANKMARQLAIHLASVSSVWTASSQLDAAKLLMPTLVQVEVTENKKLINLLPHQFVLSDDNRVVIEIYPCLDKARSKTKAKNKAQASALSHTSKGLRKELSETERLRVINHSQPVKEYVENIISYRPKELVEQKNKIAKLLNSDDYVVNPAYGKEGENRLRDKLYSDIKTREDLFLKLQQLPRELWKSYYEFIDINHFVKIMSKGKMTADDVLAGKFKMEDILQDKDLLSSNKEENRARFFSLYDCYGKIREKGPYLQSRFGLFAYPVSYNKGHKTSAVDEMLTEISTIDDIGKLAVTLDDASSRLHAHAGALKNSELGKFTDFMLQYLNSLPKEPLEEAVSAKLSI